MERFRGRTKKRYCCLLIEKFGGYKTEIKEILKEREKHGPRNKAKEEKHLEIYGRLRENIGMRKFLHGPMDYAKKPKLRFVGDLDLPARRKRFTSSREEDLATNMCPCGTTVERKTHIDSRRI